MKYSIVNAQLYKGTNEHISVAMIAFTETKLYYRISNRKLKAVEFLFGDNKYRFFKELVDEFDQKGKITEQGVSYLHRYSNNLLTVSELKEIDMPATKESADFLFNRYVENQ